MSTISETFQQAVDFHRAGDLRQAERLYAQVIAAEPRNAEAHHLLGLVALSQDNVASAIAALRTVTQLDPQHAEAQNNLGCAYRRVGQLDQAVRCFRLAVAIMPESFGAHVNLGSALNANKDYLAAAACLEKAIELNPQSSEAYNHLGAVRQNQERYDEAVAAYQRALALEPGSADVLANLGSCLTRQGRTEEAVAYLRSAIAIDPGQHLAHNRLGRCLQFQGQFDEALASYDRAIALQPAEPDYHYYRACMWLSIGDFARGWPEYEWRLKTANPAPAYPQRRWAGGRLRGERIVVYAEWGLGDTLQFVRYVPLVKDLGGDVWLHVQPSLIPLLEESGFEQVMALRSPDSCGCQWQVPLLSLPSAFHTTLETVPTKIPYLMARPTLVEKWRGRLSEFRGFRVGIHWHGRRAWAADPRPIRLSEFAPVARVPGVTLISLQKDDPGGHLRQLDGPLKIVDFGGELDASGGAFMDTAAIINCLDLVITCDTSTAHVASALGAPVWVALPRASEWRWMWDRESSPWYPTMRLFRQSRSNDWSGVFERIAGELSKLARAHRDP